MSDDTVLVPTGLRKALIQATNVRYANPNADLPTFYANNAEVQVSNWDMRFRLGQIEGATEDGTITVKNTLTVYMSVEHARAFVEKAQSVLVAWDAMNAEKNNG